MHNEYRPLNKKFTIHRLQIMIWLLLLILFGILLGFLFDSGLNAIQDLNGVDLHFQAAFGVYVVPILIVLFYLPDVTGINTFFYFGEHGIYVLDAGTFYKRWCILLYVLIYNRIDHYLVCIKFEDIQKVRVLVDRVHMFAQSFNFYNLYMKVVCKDQTIKLIISDSKMGYFSGTVFSNNEAIVNAFDWLSCNHVEVEDHFKILDVLRKGKETIWEHFEKALPQMIHFDEEGDIIESDGQAL